MFVCKDIVGDVPKGLSVKGLLETQKTLQRSVSSAPVKAFDQEGARPSQANVTSLKSTVVTAFP